MSHSGSSAVGVTTSAPSSETSAVSSDFAPLGIDGFHAAAADSAIGVGSAGTANRRAQGSPSTHPMMTPPLFREALCLVGGVEVSEDVAERPTRRDDPRPEARKASVLLRA
jgi:hypothetical protein